MLRSLSVQLLTVLVQIIVVVVGGFAIRFLKNSATQAKVKVGSDKFDFYKAAADNIVLAVEQQFPDLKGQNKYTIAAELLNKKLGGILSDDEIKELIEAAVGQMNLFKKANQTTPIQNTTVISESSATAEQVNPTAEASTPIVQ